MFCVAQFAHVLAPRLKEMAVDALEGTMGDSARTGEEVAIRRYARREEARKMRVEREKESECFAACSCLS